jgi:hypothetical protein
VPHMFREDWDTTRRCWRPLWRVAVPSIWRTGHRAPRSATNATVSGVSAGSPGFCPPPCSVGCRPPATHRGR